MNVEDIKNLKPNSFFAEYNEQEIIYYFVNSIDEKIIKIINTKNGKTETHEIQNFIRQKNREDTTISLINNEIGIKKLIEGLSYLKGENEKIQNKYKFREQEENRLIIKELNKKNKELEILIDNFKKSTEM